MFLWDTNNLNQFLRKFLDFSKQNIVCDRSILHSVSNDLALGWPVLCYIIFSLFNKGEHKIFKKTLVALVVDKTLHYTKMFYLKIIFFTFFANFIFVVSHLKILPAVHLNTLKAMISLQSKKKSLWKVY